MVNMWHRKAMKEQAKSRSDNYKRGEQNILGNKGYATDEDVVRQLNRYRKKVGKKPL